LDYQWDPPRHFGKCHGCDSLVYVDLILRPGSNIIDSTCSDYLSPSGLYTWTSSGIYSDTIPNSLGCDSVITVDLTVLTIDTTISNDLDSLWSNQSGATAYQWILCDSSLTPLIDDTLQYFNPTVNGSYAVIITQNNCVDTSSCFTINNVSLTEKSFASSLHYYPNPTDGELIIELAETYENLNVSVRNMQGQLLSKNNAKPADGKLTLSIEGAPGTYLISLKDKKGRYANFKVIKE